MDAGLVGEAGPTEGLARDLGVARIDLDGVELGVAAHPPQQRHPRVAAQRADLDRAAGTRQPREHFQVASVERGDLDVGQPGGGATRSGVDQNLVLGEVQVAHVLGQPRSSFPNRLLMP